MGLDISFIKVKRRALKNNAEVWNLPDEEIINVAYFRKVNFLIPFFDYKDNLSCLGIEKEQVEKLIKTCDLVLKYKPKEGKNLSKKDKDELERILPTQYGFFYGSTEYDCWYFKKVENVKDTFSKLLETFKWDEDALFMSCWW